MKLSKELAAKADEMKKQKEEFTCQLNDLTKKVRILSQKVEEQNGFIEQLKRKAEVEDQRRNKPSASSHFISESNPKGLISLLGINVNLTAGCYHDPRYHLSNLRNYNDDFFCNYHGGDPNSESESYIKFDFGAKRVDLIGLNC